MRTTFSLFVASALGLTLISCATRDAAKGKSTTADAKTDKPSDAAKTADTAKPTETPKPDATPTSRTASGRGTPSSGSSTNEGARETVRPYSRVITKDAKTDKGVFWVHRVEDKFYFEIQSRPMAVPFVSFGTGLPKETGGVIENEFKDFWAPRVWMGLGCPTGLSEAGQIGLLRCAQEATAATGCPIDFQQAAQFQSVPQG